MAADVAVLMSVYNGEKYIDQQIDSILAQRGVGVHLVIRNDGSTDSTATILDRRQNSSDRISILHGRNLGASQSFMTVARECNVAAPYYAFSDADDVWLPNKLRASIDVLQFITPTRPAVHISASTFVDENLAYKGQTECLPIPVPLDLENALVQARLPGAAATMNRALFDLLTSYHPKTIVMHDAWVYLLAATFGLILYEDTPYLLYRQHGNNISRDAGSFFARSRRRWSMIRAKGDLHRQQAEEFFRVFGPSMTEKQRALVLRFISHNNNFASRARFVINPQVRFNKKRSKILYLLRAALART
jgi:glycosyltransferase involved in cell wall biosynthesis